MSKRKKKKKRFNGNDTKSNTIIPKVFFKKIGIRPYNKSEGTEVDIDLIENEVLKQCGHNAIKKVETIYDKNKNAFDVFHSNLSLAKIWYGASFELLCRMATKLSEMKISENSKILDIGGGPGHFSFWMANAWNVSSIIVTDKYPHVGTQWAKDIKEDRVQFTQSILPELTEIGDERFDVIVVSRVLSFMPELELPYETNDFSFTSYFNSDDGRRVMNKLSLIGDRLNHLLEEDGKIIIVESWSDLRVLLIGKAFELTALHINLQDFSPDKVTAEPSIIVFTKHIKPLPIDDLPHSLSTALYFPDGPPVYMGAAALAIRNLFINGKIHRQFKFGPQDINSFKYQEIVELGDLLLYYIADNDSIINAYIYPNIYIVKLLQWFDEWKEEVTKDIPENSSIPGPKHNLLDI